MKRNIILWLIVLFLILLVLFLLFKSKPPQQAGLLDLGTVPVENPDTRKFLNNDFIKIRNPETSYQPSGILPILVFDSVTDFDCRDLIDWLVKKYSIEGELFYLKDIYMVKGPDAAVWVSRSSGGFKLTRIRESMSVRSSIDARKALQIALDHVAKEQLVHLSEGEELDILYASAVMNVVVQNDGDVPMEEFPSDHYIAFGRRYQGIPIVGSKLILRLAGNGDIVMVNKEWRRIQQFNVAEAEVSEIPLERTIVANSEFKRKFPDTRVVAGDIDIISKKCGFLEAPVDFLQSKLRPGCEVVFSIGHHRDEANSQLTLPLEKNISMNQLLGRQLEGSRIVRYGE